MAKGKVTIQDIANALGISRNTASKALNGAESIPAETRNKVIQKAIELKYKQFAYVDTDSLMAKAPGNIALLTCNLPGVSHFGSQLLNGLESKISSEGYNLSIHMVREYEVDAMVLPKNFEASKVDGIICIEMFHKGYTELVCSLGIPTIFIDSTSEVFYTDLQADLILMENKHSTYKMTSRLIENGHTRLGFVGDYNHCKSFNERWAGFNRALADAKLELDPSVCVVDEDRLFFSEPDWMDKQLNKMRELPTAFVCANDFIAISLMKALKNRNARIPEDVAVCGFDDSPESRIVDPHLTTSHIPNNQMGYIAADMLLARVKDPARPYQITHVKTEPIFRESTGRLKE